MKNIVQKEIKRENITYWQDMALVLSHMKRFRKAIIEAREKWGVPATGLPHDKRAGWYASFFWKPNADLDDNFYTSHDNQLLPPSRLIRATLKNLSEEFNLDSRWHFSLFLHIAGGEQLVAPNGLSSPEIRLNDSRLPMDKWVVKRMWIEIYADTSQKDIAATWKRIEEYQSMMFPHPLKKRRPMQPEVIDKYLKIRELEDKGNSQPKIVDENPQFNFITAKDLSEFKKQIEKRFSPGKNMVSY